MNGARMPADACVAPIATARSSTISTEAPRRASSYATAQPTTPAPITMMSDGRDMRYLIAREFEVAQAAVVQAVDPRVHAERLAARPRVAHDRRLTHVPRLLDGVQLAQT